ncbi:MAG: hypothetical protein OXC12_15665 [Spirochaetaceae bacterium]|nr:hypothetical protein [Spirochaetaceae bacterium]
MYKLLWNGASCDEDPSLECLIARERLINLAKQLAFVQAGGIPVLLTFNAKLAPVPASGAGVRAVLKTRLSYRNGNAEKTSNQRGRKAFDLRRRSTLQMLLELILFVVPIHRHN